MFKLVLDLEMNKTWKLDNNIYNHDFITEIIEIGAVLLNDNNDEVDKFQTYVKPDFTGVHKRITKITGIKDEDVKGAPRVEEAFNNLIDFINKYTSIDNILMYTWSNSDSTVILAELDVKNINNSDIRALAENFIDIQKEFDSKINFDNNVGLSKALELMGFDFEGVAHGALADAINTARVYKYMENDEDVKKLLADLKSMMACEELTTSLGNMIDFSKFKFD